MRQRKFQMEKRHESIGGLSNYAGVGSKNAVFSFKNFFVIVPLPFALIYQIQGRGKFSQNRILNKRIYI